MSVVVRDPDSNEAYINILTQSKRRRLPPIDFE